MQSRAHASRQPGGHDRPSPAGEVGGVRESELAAIALLCLLFAWPEERPTQPRLPGAP